jgi:hypothetical protein
MLRKLHRQCDGAASVVGFVLVLPFVLLLTLVFAQLTMLLNNAILVHHAAYSAARSARVWLWDFQSFDPRVRIGGRFFVNPVTLHDRREAVRREVEKAARFALIPVAPVSGPQDGDGAPVPDRVLRTLAQSAGLEERAEVLIRQASYAFDPVNSQVQFDVVSVDDRPDMAWDFVQPADAWPVQARVSFRVRLDLPVVRFFGYDGGDGAWYTDIDAEMTLL